MQRRYLTYSDNMTKKSSGSNAETEEAIKSDVFRVTMTSNPAIFSASLVTASSKSVMSFAMQPELPHLLRRYQQTHEVPVYNRMQDWGDAIDYNSDGAATAAALFTCSGQYFVT